jgi:hypothetical protein
LREGLSRLTPSDWLMKHTAVSEEDFAKDFLRNRLANYPTLASLEWGTRLGCTGRSVPDLALGIYQIVGALNTGAEYARSADEGCDVLVPERWSLCALSLARIGPSDAVMETTIQERNYDSKTHSVQAVAGYFSCGWMWIRMPRPSALF